MKKIYFLFVFLFVGKIVSAQNDIVKTISVNFQHTKIEPFVSDLEAKTGYRFYVDTAQFDSLKVSLQADNKPLEYILDMAFSNTNYHYIIIASASEVFLTKGKLIQTGLAVGYFDIKTTKGQPLPADIAATAITDYSMDKETPATESTTENKLYSIGIKTNNIEPGKATISGYVRDIKSG